MFEPSRLLAYFPHEREYLVDATGSDVQPWTLENVGWLTRLRRGYCTDPSPASDSVPLRVGRIGQP